MTKVLCVLGGLAVTGSVAWYSLAGRVADESCCTTPACPTVAGGVRGPAEPATQEEAELVEVIDLSSVYDPAPFETPEGWQQPMPLPAEMAEEIPTKMPYADDEPERKSTGMFGKLWEYAGCVCPSPIHAHAGCGD